MIDTVAAVLAIVWNAGILGALVRVVRAGRLILVLGFYLLSLYPGDRILPRVLVDGSRNWDVDRTEALRPFLIFPDVLLVAVVLLTVRRVSGTGIIISLGMGVATAIGLVSGILHPDVPATAATFWATVPLRAIGIVILVDNVVHTDGWERTARAATRLLAAGALLVALQLLAVWGAKVLAEAVGYDLVGLWAGFDWDRPNIPGWNNNLAASGVVLGVAGIVLMPNVARIPARLVVVVVVMSAAALLVSEYRTAIIGMAAVLGIRAAVEVYLRLRDGGQTRAVGAGVATVVLVPVLLLGVSAQVVPRLANLNPLTYLAGIAGRLDLPVDVTVPTPSPSDNLDEGEAETSTFTRIGITRAALGVWQRQPIWGPGLGTWEFDRPSVPTILQKQITTHNGYVWVLADLGLVGLVAIYALPAAAVALRRPPLSLLAWAGLAAAAEVAVVGIAHSRYSVMIWTVIMLAALAPRGYYRFFTGVPLRRGERDELQPGSR